MGDGGRAERGRPLACAVKSEATFGRFMRREVERGAHLSFLQVGGCRAAATQSAPADGTKPNSGIHCAAGRGTCLSQRDRLHPPPTHGVRRTTVFWSARGRAQGRRRFGPARIGKLTPIRIPIRSKASHEEPRNPQRGHLRPYAHRDGSRHLSPSPIPISVGRSVPAEPLGHP
jgi:hypothetical protein